MLDVTRVERRKFYSYATAHLWCSIPNVFRTPMPICFGCWTRVCLGLFFGFLLGVAFHIMHLVYFIISLLVKRIGSKKSYARRIILGRENYARYYRRIQTRCKFFVKSCSIGMISVFCPFNVFCRVSDIRQLINNRLEFVKIPVGVVKSPVRIRRTSF